MSTERATADLSRRRLLQIASAAALTLPLTALRPPAAAAGTLPPSADVTTLTLEAWSDTMIPAPSGHRPTGRSPGRPAARAPSRPVPST